MEISRYNIPLNFTVARNRISGALTDFDIGHIPLGVDHDYSRLSLPKFPVAKALAISEVIDIKNVCRACLSTQNLNNMKLIKYQDSTFIQLFEMLRNKKALDDGLSQNLCKSCVDFLIEFKDFLDKSNKVEEMLKNVANIASKEKSNDSNSPVIIDLCDDETGDNLICETQPNSTRPVNQFINTQGTGLEKSSIIPDTSHVVLPAHSQMEHSRLLDDVISFLVIKPKYSKIKETEEETSCDGEHITEVDPTRRLVHSCLCGQNYLSFHELNKHKRESQHRDRTIFKCEYCLRKYQSKSQYKNHKRTHTKEQPYICHLCGVRFTTLASLQRHERNHLGVKEFICSACGRGFAANCMLVEHEKSIHRNEKPHLCSYCGAKFGTRVKLVRHITNRHQTLNPAQRSQNPAHLNRSNIGNDIPTTFQCGKCHKYVASAWKLKLHMFIHYEVVCPECPRRFASERDLKLHRSVHDGQSGKRDIRRISRTCKYCEEEFRTKRQREEHESVEHESGKKTL